MAEWIAPAGDGPDSTTHQDDAWHAAVRIETIRMICEVHRRSLPSNLTAWAIIGCAAMALPDPRAFAVPLLLRLGSIAFNNRCWKQVRLQLEQQPDAVPAIGILGLCMLICGASWASLLQPLFALTRLEPASFAILATVTLGMSLIVTVIAPLRQATFALVAGFLLVLAAEVTLDGAAVGRAHFLVLGGAILGLLTFSIAVARQKMLTAETLVEKSRLHAKLSRALSEAEYLATRDPLTGLLNRRAFFTEDQETSGGSVVTRHLLTIDLDHFKAINDGHGHAVGDRVLSAAAEEIHGLLNVLPDRGHRACRFGGEEFVILTRDLDDATARAVAETLRKRLRTIPAKLCMEGKLAVSASIGLAKLARDETIDDALRRSDLAMYRAKHRGRDRVELAA